MSIPNPIIPSDPMRNAVSFDITRNARAQMDAIIGSRQSKAKPDYWAVHSVTGSHVGLWDKCDVAKEVLAEYPNGTLTPLYATPPVVEEAVKAETWQDIESAPKDGSRFLAVNAFNELSQPFIAKYFDGLFWVAEYHMRVLPKQGELGSPTHWQPLPAPPARSATP